MIKQIIFDCDGVLVDTEKVAAEIMVRNMAKHEVEITTDIYFKTYTGSTFSSIYKKLLPGHSDEERARFIRESEEEVYRQLVPIADMANNIKQIDLPKAVVSNSYLWQVNKAMIATGLDKFIGHRFSAEMVPNPKPAPDVYLLAAEKTGFAPEECLVVEDSKSGVTAAVSAGMHVLGFAGGSHIQDGHEHLLKERGAKHVIYKPHELLPYLKAILN